ncbi:ribonuclease BN [Brevirhabdus pacifica]|uniref:Ribonuclease BN n=1 Tax=Brevirhabdus pacifica TaxID=1267768 RepID=A0A1U7DIE0_9RHOB|nr:YihY/virulence factor BrkB family protein [Brevirhabdus pacifica]APX89695.1 ribonuclease BN [Brevirhabdus pacifica]OWU74537.1 ribonuclease BN [Loktanella sp. 22II-4b]PJJ85623.1 membrane protein [Brevirhabdus pacifica]
MALPVDHDWHVWWATLRAVRVTMDRKNLGLIAAGVGFFAMLAVFPALAALIALLGLGVDPQVVGNLIEPLEEVFPPQIYDLLRDQLSTLAMASEGTLGWTTVVSTVAAIWSARAGVSALLRGLNATYRESNRVGVTRLVSTLSMTAAAGAFVIAALGAIVVVPAVLAVIPLGPYTAMTVAILRWFIAGAVLVAGLGIIYKLGPNRRAAKAGWVTPGAVVAAVLWVAVSWLLSTYLANFPRYNEVYGSIGAAVSMLLWFYLSAYVVLLGATLNAELELRTWADTTVGPDRPMGQRGAEVADRYIEVDD